MSSSIWKTKGLVLVVSLAFGLMVGCARDIQAVNARSFEPSPTKYFVFIGKKKDLKKLEPEEEVESTRRDGSVILRITMDEIFLAKYEIIKPIRGSFVGKEIEFTVYDHYGVPPFSKFDYVLLYVVRDKDKYYHAKYMYSPLFKTKDGKWAGPYPSWDFQHAYNAETTVKAVRIDFEDKVEFDISKLEKEDVEKWYPEPYYRIQGTKAIAVYGLYVEDLFRLKQEGVLKARKQFQEFD